MKWKPHVPSLLVLLGLALYLALFYATRLPSIEQQFDANAQTKGQVWRRIDFLTSALLAPDVIWESWCGSSADVPLADRLVSLVDRLPVLTIALGILACAAAMGWLLLAACRVDRHLDRLERVVFSTAVGLNALSSYVLLAGLLGWASSRLILVPPVAAALGAAVWRRNAWTRRSPAGARAKPRLSKAATPSQRSEAAPGGDALGLRWLWLAAPFVLVVLMGAVLPPLDFDVREYHLQAPKEFYQQGRIGFLPHNVYANMPLGSEMLCLLAMNVAGNWWLGALAGKTVLAAMTPLTALGLLAAGRRFFSLTAGVVAAVVYLSIPWVIQVSTSGLVEGASACYLFLAIYAMLLWRRTQELGMGEGTGAATDGVGHGPCKTADGTRSVPATLSPATLSPATLSPATLSPATLALAGYLAGGAVACKYPAALFVVIPLTVWLLAAHRPSAWRTVWKPLGVFVLATALGCGLWFGKNWALTGNPTYPLLSEILDGKTRTPEKDRQWNRAHRPHTFSPAALAADLARVGLTSEWLSPLVMPLALLGVFSRRHRRLAMILLAWFAFTIVAWWLLTHRIDRFWIPVLPVVAMLAGLGACWTPERWCRKAIIELPLAGLALALVVSLGLAGLPFALLALVAGMWAWRLPDRLWLAPLLIVGIGSNLLVATAGGGGYNRYLASLARLRSDPELLDPWHRQFNALARRGRVLMVGDAQMFDMEVPVLYNTCFDDCLFEQLVRDKTAGQVRAALAGAQVSYVFVHWGEIKRYRDSGYGFAEFVQPAVFDKLVKEKVLEPLPVLQGHKGRAYRVLH